MRRAIIVCCVVGLVAGGVVVWRHGAELLSLGAVTSDMPSPDAGRVTDGVYRNDYFDLAYPLPEGWTQGVGGPGPSANGYYVLETLVPKGEFAGTIMIAAQDMFFAGEEAATTASMIGAVREAMSQVDGMSIDAEPAALSVAGRAMHRVDFSGVGLHRSQFVTEIRCHIVSFGLTARDQELLDKLRASLSGLAFGANKSAPPCVKDFVVADNVVERVEPELVTFEPIAVRLVIGARGDVKHVRAVRASAGQRRALEQALLQWKFKPPTIDGRPTQIETGLLYKSAVAAR
jgi:hypothetical protein